MIYNKTYLLMALTGSFVMNVIEKYLFNDWEFLKFLCVVMMVDTFFGCLKHFKKRTINEAGFAKFFTKVLMYAGILILTHVLKNYTVDGEVNGFFSWVDNFFYSAIFVREALSILRHITTLKPDLLPKWVMSRFSHFDETGDFKSFTNPPEKQEETL